MKTNKKKAMFFTLIIVVGIIIGYNITLTAGETFFPKLNLFQKELTKNGISIGNLSIESGNWIRKVKHSGMEESLFYNLQEYKNGTSLIIELDVNNTLYTSLKDTTSNWDSYTSKEKLNKCYELESHIKKSISPSNCTNLKYQEDLISKLKNQTTSGWELSKNGNIDKYINATKNHLKITIPNIVDKDLIKIGSDTLIYEYQDINFISYVDGTVNFNTTLYKKVNGTYDNTIDDLFINQINDSYKFGANDTASNSTTLNNYKYEFISNKEILHKEQWDYYITDEGNWRIINLKDICTYKAVQNESNYTIFEYYPNCSITLNNTKLTVEFQSNNIIDPEIIIEITEAEHLDENKSFISDIYDDVKEQDGNWSETIPSGDYVRVKFEVNLSSNNDITIYPRTISGTPRIEIYEKNESQVIAEFTSITDNELNKVYLTNLVGEQDSFDLLILNGSIEFDWIVDPSVSYYVIADSGTNVGSDTTDSVACGGTESSNTNMKTLMETSSTNYCSSKEAKVRIDPGTEANLTAYFNTAYTADTEVNGSGSATLGTMKCKASAGTGYIYFIDYNPSTGAHTTIATHSWAMTSGTGYISQDISAMSGVVSSGNKLAIKIRILCDSATRVEYKYGFSGKEFIFNVIETETGPSNTAPTITSNITSPTNVLFNTDFLANITVTDPEADTLTGYVQFYINDTLTGSVQSLVVTNNTNTQIGNLSNGNFTYGDNLTAEVWAGDGTDNSSKTNMTKTVNDVPQWSFNSTNSTEGGSIINHSVLWTDDTNLSGYIFSFDNGTGTFVNDSFVSMTGISNWSNVLKFANSTLGSTIRWIVYANDSVNEWNVTDTFTYDTTEPNIAPTITANVTSPTIINHNTDFLANITVTDPQSDTLTGYVQFYINDTLTGSVQSLVVTNNTNTQIGNLSNGNFSDGDNLTAEVWAGDGTENTTKTNMTKTVTTRTIGISTIYPTGDINALKNAFFNVTLNLTCLTGDCGEVNISLDPVEWWNTSWAKRKEIKVFNSYDNLTEYQVQLRIDTSALIGSGLMNSDCSDMRFTNDTTVVPYYIDEGPGLDCGETDTLVWLQTDTLVNNTNNSFYMYYDNSDATTTTSNMTNVFTYTNPKEIYYAIGEWASVSEMDLISYSSNNNVTLNSNSENNIFDRGEIYTLYDAADIATADSWNVTGPLSFGCNANSCDSVHPISFAGTEFIEYRERGGGSKHWYVYAPFSDGTVYFYNATSGGSYGSPLKTLSVTKRTIYDVIDSDGNEGDIWKINSTTPVMIGFAYVAYSDTSVYVPASDNRWGQSEDYAFAYPSSSIEIWNETTHRSATVDGPYRENTGGNADGLGMAYHINSTKNMGGGQTGDSDGAEALMYWPEEELSKEYYTPVPIQYMSGSLTNGSSCTFWDTIDWATSVTISGSNDYPYPKRVYVGDGTASPVDDYAPAGSLLNCSSPFFIGFDNNFDEESNLLSWKQSRQYVWPEPSYVIESQETQTTTGKGGLIPVNSGTPFYTNASSNPLNITLSEGESQTVTFWINATGENNTEYVFYAYANLTSNMAINNITSTWNVTILDTLPGGDSTPPTYSNINHNQTVANVLTNFSILWDDETSLHPLGQYIFSTNNTGVWTNDSAINFTTTSSWANVEKTLNDTVGIAIGYRWYATDNASNLKDTGIQVLTTTSADTCTAPGSGNWAITCSDNCVFNTDFSVPANISITGSGTITWNANMTMGATSWQIYKSNSCDMVINSGGSIR